MVDETSAETRERVVAAIAKLWEEGCPVASRPNDVAPIAIRRWLSSTRRGVKSADFHGRVRDLANGLISHFEREPRLVGPLRKDYECVAERVAEVLKEGATPGKR